MASVNSSAPGWAIVLGRNSRWVGPQNHAKRFRTWMSSSTDEERRRRNTVVVDTYGRWEASEKHNNSRMTAHPQLNNTHRNVQQITNQLCSGSTPSVPALNVQAHNYADDMLTVVCIPPSGLRVDERRTNMLYHRLHLLDVNSGTHCITTKTIHHKCESST